MRSNKTFYIFLVLVASVPLVSHAALAGLGSLIVDFGGLINGTIRVIFGLALAFFFWGGAQFILNDASSDKTREEGKKKMIWSIIALFVMFSIYGILNEIGGLIGIPVSNTPLIYGPGN